LFDSYGIRLGPLYVHFYALILLAGIVAAAWLSARRAKARGLNPEMVWDGLMWAIIPGLIGARLYHVLTPSPASGLSLRYYLEHPEQILAIWNGGLGVYGAVAGGLLGIWIYARRKKQDLPVWLDIVVPALALAQAIGRWGNFVNQELYGAPSTLPWAVYIPPAKRLPGFENFETYHPLFLYESILNLIACIALLAIERRFADRLKKGDLLLIYLMMYPVIRILMDMLRLDNNGFGAVTTAQLVSAVLFLAALAVLIVRHRRTEAAVQAQP
jgi:phosphatidylglycerol:prolipoprotein diacylglycerol transferase